MTEQTKFRYYPLTKLVCTRKQTRVRTKLSKHKISPFKLNESFVIEIRSDVENINIEIFREYIGNQNP